MTLIESLVLALIHGLSRFLPLGSEAHEQLLQQLLGWPVADPAWRSSFAIGSLLALLLFFIHDWASIFSSFIQVLLRKKPMTFDERFPLFLMGSLVLPALGYWYCVHQLGLVLDAPTGSPARTATVLAMAGGAVLLWMGERWNRRNKGLFDLNAMDAVLFGIAQCAGVLPGMNPAVGLMIVCLFRNYHLEAATKLVGLFSLPLILMIALGSLGSTGDARIDWHSGQPLPGTGWIQWILSVVIAAGATYFGLKVLTDQIRRSGYAGWITYRMVLAALLLGLHLWAATSG